MKTASIYRAGFTLTELLVTIGIIALVAALLLPAVNGALKKAEQARAQQEISSIVAAIKAYVKEYGIPPSPSSAGYDDVTYVGKSQLAGQQAQSGVMGILRGLASSETNNRRMIQFLEVPSDSMIGTDYAGNDYVESDGYFLDPWGNPYVICMDTDFDDEVGISGLQNPPSPAAGFVVRGQKALVLSYGPDMTKTNKFMKSW